jgi:hypothetical protein
MPHNVSAATAGTPFMWREGPNDRSVEVEIGPTCSEKVGNWFCITHQEHFPNQLQKDGHIMTGTHVLAWNCYLHGPEQP